jgi:hypothetical protein
MVKNYILPAAFAVMCAGAVASAQSTATPQQPQTQPPASMDQAATTTVEGCVYREQDIPGRAGNTAERTAAAAGVGDNYVLVASSGSAASGTVGTSGSTGATGSASASPKIFKLEHSDDSKLSAMVGKRVRVMGKVDSQHSASPSTTTPPQTEPRTSEDKKDLPEFTVSSITESTTGTTCPATPEIRK